MPQQDLLRATQLMSRSQISDVFNTLRCAFISEASWKLHYLISASIVDRRLFIENYSASCYIYAYLLSHILCYLVFLNVLSAYKALLSFTWWLSPFYQTLVDINWGLRRINYHLRYGDHVCYSNNHMPRNQRETRTMQPYVACIDRPPSAWH
jgi:hypothetical protein